MVTLPKCCQPDYPFGPKSRLAQAVSWPFGPLFSLSEEASFQQEHTCYLQYRLQENIQINTFSNTHFQISIYSVGITGNKGQFNNILCTACNCDIDSFQYTFKLISCICSCCSCSEILAIYKPVNSHSLCKL